MEISQQQAGELDLIQDIRDGVGMVRGDIGPNSFQPDDHSIRPFGLMPAAKQLPFHLSGLDITLGIGGVEGILKMRG